jgi:hypothetical protein
MSEQQFEWGPLGPDWWAENGRACRATELQIRFACARHQGAQKNRAAELAGYSGDADQLRSAGSRADGTTAVEDLLALAAATAAGVADDPVTIHEAKRKVGKLVRSPDPTVALKASELFVKLEVAERQRGEAPEHDGFADWRWGRSLLQMENGASIFMLMAREFYGNLGWPGNYMLFHDVHYLAMREPFGKQIWDWACTDCSDQSRKALERQLADPAYQLEDRKQIWGEIGKQPPAPIGLSGDWRVAKQHNGVEQQTSVVAEDSNAT